MSLSALRQKLVDHTRAIFALDARRREAFAMTMLDLVRGAEVSDCRLAQICGVSPNQADSNAAAQGEGPRERAQRLARPIIVPGGSNRKATAIISFRGVVLYDYEYQPYAVSALMFAQTVEALAADDNIGAIVVDMDSPGGVVTGVKEAADALFAARKAGKTTVVLVNPLSASAGYWIASQAGEVIGVPSCEVGSVGVFMLHLDYSQFLAEAGIKPTFIFSAPYKVEGNSFEPLSEETKAQWQIECDACYQDFLDAVARGREIDADKVRSAFGEGRTKTADDAKRSGMIDRIDTIAGAFRRVGIVVMEGNSLRRVEADSGGVAASESAEEPQAPADERDERRQTRMKGRLALAHHAD